MKTGKAPGPSEVSLELFVACGGVGIHVMADICQKVLDGFGMPAELALSIVVPNFKGKVNIRNCSLSCVASLAWHEGGGKVELKKMLCRIMSVDEMQFGFMPERETIDAVFILRRMQAEYHAKGKNRICVLWT